MVAFGRLDVVGPLPGTGFAGELLGLVTGDRSAEPLPVRLVPVPDHVISDPSLIAQLGRDAAAAAELLHPDILRSFGIEDVRGTTMQVLAYVEAHTLRMVLQVGGRLPPPMAARILVDASRAIQFAQDKGKGSRLQGEISLDTILVADKGTALVSGLGGPLPSRVPREQLLLRSPEQIVAGASVLTPETDVYLLGSLLYACLTGDLPFADEPDPDGAVLSKRVPSLANQGIPATLAAVVMKAIAKKAQDRFRSPGVLADEIARAVGELAEPAALATYVELLFPDEPEREERRAAVQAALAERGVSVGGKPAPALVLEPPAPPPEPPRPSNLPDAPEAQESAPPEPRRRAEPDLVSTMDIVLEPPRPPRTEPVAEPVGNAKPEVEAGQPAAASEVPRAPYAPDLVRTVDIVLEPPGPAQPEPVEPVSNADIVADTGRVGVGSVPKAPYAPELIQTMDIVLDSPLPEAKPAEVFKEGPSWPQPLPPVQPPPRRWVGLLVVALVCLAIGFCLSFFMGVGVPGASASSASAPSPTASVGQRANAPASGASAITPPSQALLGQGPLPRAPDPEPVLPPEAAEPKAQPEPRTAPATSISVAADPPGNVYVDGKLAGRAPLVKQVSRGIHQIRLRSEANGIDVTRTVDVRGAETRVRFALGKGTVTVTAPPGASIFIDGRQVGTTEVRQFPVWEGSHKLLVTLGTARQTQAFQLGVGETYTYEVTRTSAP